MLRFLSPHIRSSEELRWVLSAAHAAEPKLVPGAPLGAARAVALARALDVAARIAGRIRSDALVDALGPAAALTLVQQRLAVVAGNRLLLRTFEQVARVASSLGIPLVALKFAALISMGVVREGDRDARDLDLLVPSADLPRLRAALLREGYRPLPGQDPAYLQGGLLGAQQECVELTDRITGLTIAAANQRIELDFETLVERRLVTRAGEAGLWLPSRELLSAHLIAHALIQHATVPSYPAMRLVGDLLDVTAGANVALSKLEPYFYPGFPRELAEGVFELLLALRLGQDPDAWPERAVMTRIFRHLVGSACDEPYQRSLKLWRLAKLVRERRLRDVLTPRPALATPELGGASSRLQSVYDVVAALGCVVRVKTTTRSV